MILAQRTAPTSSGQVTCRISITTTYSKLAMVGTLTPLHSLVCEKPEKVSGLFILGGKGKPLTAHDSCEARARRVQWVLENKDSPHSSTQPYSDQACMASETGHDNHQWVLHMYVYCIMMQEKNKINSTALYVIILSTLLRPNPF